MSAVTPRSAEHGAPALQKLKRTCDEIRALLLALQDQSARAKEQRVALDKARFKQQRWQVLVLLSALKAGLRDTFLEADAWKTRVQEQKDVVEAHQLKLQNLLYEKDHLLREIRRCRGFSTKEMDKIEFENGKLPIAVDPESHRQHLDQLTQELETRKRMIAQLKQLKARIEQIDAASQAKQSFLDGLRQEVATIEDATTALQKYMGAPVSAKLSRQHDATTQLPAALYTLYCELEAYQIASDASSQMGLAIVDATAVVKPPSAHQKRRFPSALQLGNGSLSMDPDASAKRLKAASRSPSVVPSATATSTTTSTDVSSTRAAPSRSPSVLRAKAATPALISFESGEIVTTGTAEKLLALRPYEEDDKDKEKESTQAEAMDVDATANTANEDDAKHAAENSGDDDDTAHLVDLWKPSDKALQLTLSLSVDGERVAGTPLSCSFSLLFQYLPVAKIVTVELVSKSPAISNSNKLQTVLMNLFPDDDGLTLPRLAGNYEFVDAKSGHEVQFPIDATCRPYYWAQWICGLHPMKRHVGNDNGVEAVTRRPEPSVRSVMQQLVKRLVTSVHLSKQLEQLHKASSSSSRSNNVVFVHAAVKALFSTGEHSKTQVESWTEIPTPTQDYFQLFKAQATRANFHLSTDGCRYFRIVLANDRVKMPAIVEISPEYPVRAPRFVFQSKAVSSISSTTADKNGALSTYENQLKDIEVEVNADYNELVPTPASEPFLLMHQVRKVQLCVDVLTSALADGTSATLCFGRERRGKDRRQAIVMDPASKELRHR
uniref:THO complex subunit 5 n=1 Tax=Globisporangium ultimum (strain ATCC 200006 / CBS 805.95 / DAOM BR144) TaxID=431595 RepID=K3WTF9_GLOUD